MPFNTAPTTSILLFSRFDTIPAVADRQTPIQPRCRLTSTRYAYLRRAVKSISSLKVFASVENLSQYFCLLRSNSCVDESMVYCHRTIFSSLFARWQCCLRENANAAVWPLAMHGWQCEARRVVCATASELILEWG